MLGQLYLAKFLVWVYDFVGALLERCFELKCMSLR